jgi:hypothetical protein
MGPRYFSSPSHVGRISSAFVALAVLSACSLMKKEDDAGNSTNATSVVVPAAPVFNVNTPQAAQPVQPTTTTPVAVHPEGVTATNKTKTTVTTTSGGATSRTSIAAAQGGSPTSATTTRASSAGGATSNAAATTAAVAVPQVDMACVNSCGSKLQACIAAAGLDGTKLAACQNVVTTCQSECKK